MKHALCRTLSLALAAACLIAAVGVRPARAVLVILYVVPGGLTSGSCGTWETGCDLQYALNTAAALQQVWVKKGIYRPTTDPAARDATFQIKSGLGVYGGFAGTEASTEFADRDWTHNRTILSGDIDNNDTNTDGNRVAEKWTHIKGGNSYKVVYMDGVSAAVQSDTVLDGFIITAGDGGNSLPGGGLRCEAYGAGGVCSPTLQNLTFSGNRGQIGGAMFTYAPFGGIGSPTLQNVTFRGNYGYSNGGAMFNEGKNGGTSSPHLSEVTFTGNYSMYDGGAMYNSAYNTGHSNPVLEDVAFLNNTAEHSGGAIYNYAYTNGTSSPLLTRATFSGNYAVMAGGAIYNEGTNGGASSPVLINVTFKGNHVDWNGGAITNNGGGGTSSPVLLNVTFKGNSAEISAGAMHSIGGSGVSLPSLRNVILWGDTAPAAPEVYNYQATPTYAYSIVQGSGGSGSWNDTFGTDGTNNLDADPLLAALASNGGYTQTMLLKTGSPAINAGTNVGCPAADQRGVARPQAATCDIGATEVPEPTRTFRSQATKDGWVLESGQGTNTGGSKNAGSTKIRLGDTGSGQEYRGVLSFNTADLPDTAVLTSLTLRIKEAGIVGTNPFFSKNLDADCVNGTFGAASLELGDLSAPATYNAALTVTVDETDGWHGTTIMLNLDCINKTGISQFRLVFPGEDGNGTDDYANFWSGDVVASQRPQLIITYYLPPPP